MNFKNKTLSIFGNGKQIGDYIYIDDLVNAFLLCSSPKANGQIYNLCFGKGISFVDMAFLIKSVAGKGQIRHVKWPDEAKEVETGDYVSNVNKIKIDLNFTPKIGFKEGVVKTIKSQ